MWKKNGPKFTASLSSQILTQKSVRRPVSQKISLGSVVILLSNSEPVLEKLTAARSENLNLIGNWNYDSNNNKIKNINQMKTNFLADRSSLPNLQAFCLTGLAS